MIEKNVLLFKCLSDASRLRIINHLFKGPMYVELLSEILDLKPATVSFHLKKLEEAELVESKKEQYYTIYSLNKEVFNHTLVDLVKVEETDEDKKREEQYRQKVINNFFEYGKLKSIPVQQKKRRIILEEIGKKFNKGKKYKEKEVNIIIADFHDDFCTLRRGLVEEKILTRKDGIYEKR